MFVKPLTMLKNYMKFLLVFFCCTSFSQTTIGVGNIVFNTVNTSSAEDSFSFTPLINLEVGTVIHFTDKEWDATNKIFIEDEAETIITWVATQPVLAGKTIGLTAINTVPIANVGMANGVMDLSIPDNVFIFQGSESSPVFLNVFSTKIVTLPEALTSYTLFVQHTVASGYNNFIYNCNVTEGTKSTLFSLFSSPNNFYANLNEPYDLGSNCDVTVTDNDDVASDTEGPIVLGTLPSDDATEVELDTDLTLMFDENVYSGIGAITLKNSQDDSVVETFYFTVAGVQPSGITISDQTVTIDLTSDLLVNNSYYLEIGNNVFGDNALNPFEGIADKTTFNFSATKDLPEITSYTPTPNSDDISLSENIVILFDRDIQWVPSSEETIKVGSRTLSLTDPQINITNKTLTINFDEDFDFGTSYNVVIPDNAIQSMNYGVFEGTSFSFSTESECGSDQEKVEGFPGCLDKCGSGIGRDEKGDCVSGSEDNVGKKIPDSKLATLLSSLGYYDITNDELLKKDDLIKLVIDNKEIDSLDGLELFPNLEKLECEGNKLTKINMGFPKLKFLDCSNNLIDTLRLAGSPQLSWLICTDNKMKDLDVSSLVSLRGIDCSNNLLESLNIKNGKNSEFDTQEYINASGYTVNEIEDNNILEFNATGNPNLDCITVDNPIESYKVWSDYVDDITVTNFTKVNCLKLAIDDPNFEAYLVEKNIDNVVDGFVIASNLDCVKALVIDQSEHEITNLVLSSYFTELTSLSITNTTNVTNTITDIHIENLPKLESLTLRDLGRLNSFVIESLAIKNVFAYNTNVDLSNVLTNLSELETLTFYNTYNYTTLDISNNTHLNYISIDGSDLTELNVANITTLKNLNIEYSPLTSLGLGSIDLESLYLNSVSLTGVDLSNNQKLQIISIVNDTSFTTLDIKSNLELESLALNSLLNFTTIDVSSNLNLQFLNLIETGLTDLDVTNNSKLEVLNTKLTKLTGLDVSQNLELTSLSIQYLDKIDVTNNVKLTHLDISKSQISAINLSHNPLLERLYADSTLFTTSVDISNNINLSTVSFSNSAIGSIDVSKNINIERLYLSDTKISTLDINSLKLLTHLNIANNSFSELKTHKNKLLQDFNFSNNAITELDLKMNVNLYELDGAYNNLTSLDLSKNKSLQDLSLSNNQLHTLNLKSGNDKKQIHQGTAGIQTINLTINDLTCVVVDNYIYSAANWFDSVDEGVDFIEEEACGENKYVTVNDENFEQALIDLGYDDVIDQTIIHQNVKEVSNLDVANKEIEDLTGIEAFSRLETLNANNNLLTSFDFSYIPNLVDIAMAENQLTSVNIPNYSNLLKNINLSKNEFETLTFLYQKYDNSGSYLFDSFNVHNNNNLHCVNVSDTLYFRDNFTKGEHTVLSKNCSTEEFKKIAIEDGNFEQALVDLNYDDIVDGFVVNDSIKEITDLDISNKNITSLKGINYFQKLRILNAEGNNIEQLDVSNLGRLDSLNCSNNHIKKINLFNVTSTEGLLNLDCSYNEIESIDFEAITLIEKIKASNNLLSAVDLSLNEELGSLNISNNKLMMLNLKNGRNDSISYVNIKDNLEELTCVWVDNAAYSTEYWMLKDENVVYSEFQCGTLTDFNDEVFEGMYDTYINGKVATEKIETEETISFNYNQLVTDLTGLIDFISLTEINLSGSPSETIDFTDNMYVEKLTIKNCSNLTSIDISGLTNLKELTITNNYQLEELDLSNNQKLVSVRITDNTLLEEINFDELTNLKFASLACNSLTNLDLTDLTGLESIYGFGNSLEELSLRNNNNVNIQDFYFTGNESLQCIEVDNASYSTIHWPYVDEFATYSEDCYSSLSANELTEDKIGFYVYNGTIYSSDQSIIKVYNFYGQEVINKNLELGVYIVKAIDDNGKARTLKVLVD